MTDGNTDCASGYFINPSMCPESRCQWNYDTTQCEDIPGPGPGPNPNPQPDPSNPPCFSLKFILLVMVAPAVGFALLVVLVVWLVIRVRRRRRAQAGGGENTTLLSTTTSVNQ